MPSKNAMNAARRLLDNTWYVALPNRMPKPMYKTKPMISNVSILMSL